MVNSNVWGRLERAILKEQSICETTTDRRAFDQHYPILRILLQVKYDKDDPAYFESVEIFLHNIHRAYIGRWPEYTEPIVQRGGNKQ